MCSCNIVLFLAFTSSILNSVSSSEINIKYTDLNVSEKSEPIYVAIKDTLNIKISGIELKKASCYIIKTDKPQKVVTKNVDYDRKTKENVIKVPYLEDDMSTRWKCSLTTNDNQKKNFLFKLHIKGAKQVDMSIGRVSIKPTIANLNLAELDGNSTYKFEVGETIDFLCSDPNREGVLIMEYYDSKGKILFKTDPIKYINHKQHFKANFRKTLSATNDNDYIVCKHIGFPENVYYNYQTNLQLRKNPLKRTSKVIVDGKTLSTNSHINNLQYKYIENEKHLIVSCLEPEYNAVTANYNDMDSNISAEKEYSPNNITLEINKDKLHGTLTCGFRNEKTNITFIPDENEPFILGLNSSDIIQEYTLTPDHVRVDYRFTEGETLTLQCVGKNTRPQWMQDSPKQTASFNISNFKETFKHLSQEISQEISKGISKGIFIGIQYIYDSITSKTGGSRKGDNFRKTTITFTKEHDGQILICEGKINSLIKQRDLKLFRKEDIVNNSMTETVESVQNEAGTDDITIIVIFPVFFLVLIIGGCILYKHKNRVKTRKQDVYENFNETTETPIPPYPAQWVTRPRREEIMVENDLYSKDGPVYAIPYKAQEPEYFYPVIDLNTRAEGPENTGKNNYDDQNYSVPVKKSTGIYSNPDNKEGNYSNMVNSDVLYSNSENINPNYSNFVINNPTYSNS
ncbi:uncharacterized protein LOC142984747 isoform X2 [Anticarsia gemmatalis]|uniref:uncharacterized protein LOC142984747 isoform X2 n=1 Tax=Anticarsia gemmatalis TaxID=129554 RepID=UPI003F7644BF